MLESKVGIGPRIEVRKRPECRLHSHGAKQRKELPMKFKSLVSIVAKSENARDRRLAVRKSWSTSEKEERRQEAVNLQLRLASLMTMEQNSSNRIKAILEFTGCCKSVIPPRPSKSFDFSALYSTALEELASSKP